jgi:hypothetical protein
METQPKPKTDYSKYVNKKKDIKIQCEVCPEGVSYSYYNKTHHLKSRVHQSCQKLRESLNTF